MLKSKNIISFDDQLRKCTKCNRILPFSNFSMNGRGYVRPSCKECHCIEATESYKKTLLKTGRYEQCHACDHVFRSKKKHKNKEIETRQCPRCKMTKIDVEEFI